MHSSEMMAGIHEKTQAQVALATPQGKWVVSLTTTAAEAVRNWPARYRRFIGG